MEIEKFGICGTKNLLVKLFRNEVKDVKFGFRKVLN